jgi:hypothetical protein
VAQPAAVASVHVKVHDYVLYLGRRSAKENANK